MANEVRLIDANALQRTKIDIEGGASIVDIARALITAIDVAPTIDPESLRPKGRWNAWNGEPMWQKCSACGYSIQYSYSKDCNYCPHCGAKMEG